MTEQNKQGFIKRIFGGSNKSCCSIEFEEVNEKEEVDLVSNDIDKDSKSKVITSVTFKETPTRPKNYGIKPGCGCG